MLLQTTERIFLPAAGDNAGMWAIHKDATISCLPFTTRNRIYTQRWVAECSLAEYALRERTVHFDVLNSTPLVNSKHNLHRTCAIGALLLLLTVHQILPQTDSYRTRVALPKRRFTAIYLGLYRLAGILRRFFLYNPRAPHGQDLQPDVKNLYLWHTSFCVWGGDFIARDLHCPMWPSPHVGFLPLLFIFLVHVEERSDTTSNLHEDEGLVGLERSCSVTGK